MHSVTPERGQWGAYDIRVFIDATHFVDFWVSDIEAHRTSLSAHAAKYTARANGSTVGPLEHSEPSDAEFIAAGRAALAALPADFNVSMTTQIRAAYPGGGVCYLDLGA